MIGAIIAGGANSRFGGEAKGLLTVGGTRIIDRVARALRGVTTDLVVVSSAPDAGEWIPGIPVAADVRQERVSLVGIHTALSYASGTVMVVAWDMPFVTAGLLQRIRDRGRDEEFATVPETVNGPEPFCAMYAPSCLPMVEAALDAGAFRMSSVLQRFPSITRVASEELVRFGSPARLFFNVNDARDLQAAEKMAAGA